MWRLSLFFLAGSVALTVWLGYEAGIFGWTDGLASENPVTTVAPQAAAAGSHKSDGKSDSKPDSGIQSLEKSLQQREKHCRTGNGTCTTGERGRG